MRKTIIYLSLALLTFTNVTLASVAEGTPRFELFGEYRNTTPLGMAISKGDVATTKKIIEYGGNINEKCNGMTPLMIAARYNNVEIINLLLEKGADLRVKDEKGYTALKYAEISNATGAVETLKAALKA